MPTSAARRREEIPAHYRWDVESVFASDAAWEVEYETIVGELPALDEFRGRLHDGPRVLFEALDLRERLGDRVGKVFTYAYLIYAQDTTQSNAARLQGRGAALGAKFSAAISFFGPEILSLGAVSVQHWCEEESRLHPFRQFFDGLFRQAPHVRSSEVEELLGLTAEPFSCISGAYSMLVNADLKFGAARDSNGGEHPVFQGNIGSLLGEADRELRKSAWESYADGHLAFKNTLAATLSGAVKQFVFRSRACRYDSALESALFAHNVPASVFHNLISVFREKAPVWRRYFALRRRTLGLSELRTYDLWAPLTQRAPTLSYERAVEMICSGMAPLGTEYVDTMRRGCLVERWVDVYPNHGKSAGAFSGGTRLTHPFILMSFTDDVPSLSTLAHELGHSMHSNSTWRNQPSPTADYSIFVAEVASNFNQALVRAHLLETEHDPLFRIAVIEEAIRNFLRYLFIMPTLARFELEVHERLERGISPAAEDFVTLMADLFAEGYGHEVRIDRERDGITWAEFPHLYSNFYVYQYATGIAGAHALAHDVLSGTPGAADRYREFLGAGSSLYPLDALKRAGCDLSSQKPIERGFETLSSYINRLEELVG